MKGSQVLACLLVVSGASLSSSTPFPRGDQNENFDSENNSTDSPWDARDPRDYPSYEVRDCENDNSISM